MKDTMIGVDLAKRVFQVHGATMRGEVQFRRKLTREQFRVLIPRDVAPLFRNDVAPLFRELVAP